eukprot:403342163
MAQKQQQKQQQNQQQQQQPQQKQMKKQQKQQQQQEKQQQKIYDVKKPESKPQQNQQQSQSKQQQQQQQPQKQQQQEQAKYKDQSIYENQNLNKQQLNAGQQQQAQQQQKQDLNIERATAEAQLKQRQQQKLNQQQQKQKPSSQEQVEYYRTSNDTRIRKFPQPWTLNYTYSKPQKILIKGLTSSSHLKINTGIAESLALQGYNVSMIINNPDETIEKLKLKGVNVLIEPKLSDEVNKKNRELQTYARKNQNLWNIWDVSSTNVEKLFQHQLNFYKIIKAEKFDMIISEQMQYQQMLVNFLEIPIFLHIMNGPAEGDLYQKLGEPLLHSSQLNLQRQLLFKNMPQDFSYVRLQHFLTQFIQKTYLIWRVKWKAYTHMLPEEQHFVQQTRYQNLTLILGYEGINPAIPMTPGVKFVPPKYKQQLQGKDLIMNEELAKFYQDNDKIMLIAFGTQFSPPEKKLAMILDFMKFASTKHGWAFVFVTKNEKVIPKDQEAKLKQLFPRIMKQTFVPQVTLLNHPHTRVFLTHGGQNSVYESLEAAVPMMVFPISVFDQFMFCYYISMNKLGSCIRTTTPKYLLEQLLQVEKDNFYKDNLLQMSRVINERRNDSENLEYWVDYIFEVGVEQFRTKQFHKMYFMQFMDLDITSIVLLLILYVLYKIIKKIVLKAFSLIQQHIDFNRLKNIISRNKNQTSHAQQNNHQNQSQEQVDDSTDQQKKTKSKKKQSGKK